MVKRTVLWMSVIFVAGALSSEAAEPGTQEQQLIVNMLAAVEKNDYEAFLKDASLEMKAGMTKIMLEGVSGQMAPRMKKGYRSSYLGSLNQQGCKVHLWKLTYEAGGDDTLVKLVVRGKQVAGFWLQ